MRIKKIKNNQYIKTDNYDYWIRNYTNSSYYLDINNKIPKSEYFLLMENEFWNNKNRYPWIDYENFIYDTAIIISDGYDLDNIYPFIENLSSKDKICLIGVNGILKNWKCRKSLNYYVVNNPYEECLSFLPNHNRTLPKCVASNRTNYLFLQNYNGTKYRYSPVSEENFCFNKNSENFYQLDDYRNPICASIGLAYRFKVNKIIFLCCDDVFKESKPGSTPVDDQVYCYDQQNLATEIIDSYLHWIKNNIDIAYYCRWKKIKNADYIDIRNMDEFINNGN
jgi:hypothetical protein